MTVQRRYWDSNAFLGWLNDEKDKAGKCEGVLVAAEDGLLQIVTSALTLTEVIKMKGHPKIHRDKEVSIREFFENDFIIIREVDRFVAEDARELIWQHNVDPKDAIHLATALRLNLSVFDTFDDDLIKLSGKLGSPKLVIGHPHALHQPELDLGVEHSKPKHLKGTRKKRR
jgi:predicted nucleic acid-binding protein